MTPATTGVTGELPRNAVHTSVPPETLAKGTFATYSYAHVKPDSGSGAPVEPMPDNAVRS